MRIRHCYQNQAATGFTAIELMVVVAILAILAALAGPSFNGLIERWRVRQAVEGLQSALHYARSEAIKRGGGVVLQKIANRPGGCTTAGSNDWECGWFICADTNGNNACNTREPVLHSFGAQPKLQISRGSGGNAVVFNRWGTVTGTFAGFAIVPQDFNSSHPAARGVCMSAGGRITVIPPEEIGSPPCRK